MPSLITDLGFKHVIKVEVIVYLVESEFENKVFMLGVKFSYINLSSFKFILWI